MPLDSSSQQTQVTVPVLVDGELQCRRCGEQERQGMLRCQRTDCPYTRVTTSGYDDFTSDTKRDFAKISTIGGFSFMFVLFILFLSGNYPESSASSGVLFTGVFIIILFVIPAIIVHFKRSTERHTLFDAATGVTSHREILFAIEIRRKVVLPIEKLHFPPCPFPEDEYLASAATLRFKMRGLLFKEAPLDASFDAVARMYIVTIADLAARELVEVWRANVLTKGLMRKQDVDYVMLPGKNAEQAPGYGPLEHFIMRTTTCWPANPTMNENGNTYMLVYRMFREQVTAPAKTLLEIVDNYRRQHLTEISAPEANAKASQWYDQILSMHSDFVRVVTAQVGRALSACTKSNVEWGGPSDI